jgi:hypothetical protein
MKTKLCRKAKQLASSLLVVLVICTILSLSVAGYLSLIEQQNLLSARSQSWNIAIAIVEAGIEEGLQQLNSNYGNLASNGWTKSGNLYSRSQTLADGNTYTVTIDYNSSFDPWVSARASVTLPLLARNNLTTLFASAGITQPSPSAVTRAVRVHCSRSDLFAACLVAKHVIDLKGNGVYTDSYDSSDPVKSTNTHYDFDKYSGDFGDIATNDGLLSSSVGVQNANIFGTIHTKPDVPVSIGTQGGIGPHGAQVSDVTTAAEKGYILRDANFTFPDTTLPSTAGLFQPTNGTVVAPVFKYNTNFITSAVYPEPPPAWGVVTNTSFKSDTAIPNPIPPGLVSNATWHTVYSLPSPTPAGLITNIITQSITSDTYPQAATYVGGVTVNYNGNSSNIKSYTYNKIVNVSYSYPTYVFSYTSYTYTYTLVATEVTYATNYYDNIVGAGVTNYANSLPGKTLIAGPNTCLILPNGLSGTEDFTIAPGASVLIYAGGSAVTLNGNQIVNPNGFAGSFMVFCAPSVTTFTLNGNAEFTGVLVAPEANLTMNGGGWASLDFCGSLMVNNVTMNGHFRFHWDESLGNLKHNGRYIIRSWDEINPFAAN